MRADLVIPVFFLSVVFFLSFFDFFFVWTLTPDVFTQPTITRRKLPVNISIIFGRFALMIRQNFHESRCRKLLGIQWHQNPLDESKDD